MSCGMTYAVDGLELRSRDTLKLGLLTLHGGVWNGRRILNEAFIKEATAAHTEANASRSYGYFWWVPDVAVNGKPCLTQMAFGAGGQVIYVVPEYQLVVVFTADKVYEHKILRSLLQMEILSAFRTQTRE
jgi:CubicO group peptidase (beta-lactamase class C family)